MFTTNVSLVVIYSSCQAGFVLFIDIDNEYESIGSEIDDSIR
jgi:hypothetical protein